MHSLLEPFASLARRAALVRRPVQSTAVAAVWMTCVGPMGGCVPDGLDFVELEVGGVTRNAYVHTPEDLTDDAPLVLAFHGAGLPFGDRGWNMAVISDLNDVSDAEDFVVVYPSSVGSAWTSAPDEGVDDLGFVEALIDRMVTDARVDRARVYATGFSNGGFFSVRLACEKPSLVTAVASVAGGMLEGQVCPAPQPTPMMLVVNSEDKVVPPEGGPVAGVQSNRAQSQADVVGFWTARNACDGTPERVVSETAEDGTRGIVETFACDGGREVVAVRVEGGGHQWPGGNAAGPVLVSGPVAQGFDASQAVWDFFARAPLREAPEGEGQ